MLLGNQSQNIVNQEVDMRYQESQIIPGREVSVARRLAKDTLLIQYLDDRVGSISKEVKLENF